MSAREAYFERMKLELAELNSKMDVLDAKARGATEKARERYTRETSKLRLQHT